MKNKIIFSSNFCDAHSKPVQRFMKGNSSLKIEFFNAPITPLIHICKIRLSCFTRHPGVTVRCLSVSSRANSELHSKRFEKIITKRWTTEDVPKQTKAKSVEYRVKLGGLCCGRRGRSRTIVTLSHSTGLASIGGSNHENDLQSIKWMNSWSKFLVLC